MPVAGAKQLGNLPSSAIPVNYAQQKEYAHSRCEQDLQLLARQQGRLLSAFFEASRDWVQPWHNMIPYPVNERNAP
jgi:hypothetical protein